MIRQLPVSWEYRASFTTAMALSVHLNWLEAGEQFGNLMEDIRYFVEQGKVLAVHFRNLSAPMPYFEEVLLEDGYADMYEIMKQLVRCGCDALISVDHASHGVPEFGGMAGAYGYSTGYMKGLLYAAEQEVKRVR